VVLVDRWQCHRRSTRPLQGVISKCEADVFRGVCLCRCARPAKQIPPNEKIELAPNESRAPERNSPEQFAALLCLVSKRQLLPPDSTTSCRREPASGHLVSLERFHRNGEGNLPCLPSHPAGFVRLNSRRSMSLARSRPCTGWHCTGPAEPARLTRRS
jgi:hypothetical protein